MSRGALTLVLALVVGGVAMFLARSYLKTGPQPPKKYFVVVARQTITPGTSLNEIDESLSQTPNPFRYLDLREITPEELFAELKQPFPDLSAVGGGSQSASSAGETQNQPSAEGKQQAAPPAEGGNTPQSLASTGGKDTLTPEQRAELERRMRELPVFFDRAGLQRLADAKSPYWASQTIGKGEIITRDMLGDPATIPGVYTNVRPGYRGISIKVTPETGGGGHVLPGNYVDVGAVYTNQRTAKILLQNVKVLAVGEAIKPDPRKAAMNAQTVVLELKPEEANLLQVAVGQRGTLRLLIRGNKDDQLLSEDKLEVVYGESEAERLDLRQKLEDLDLKHNMFLAEKVDELKGGRPTTPTATVKAKAEPPARRNGVLVVTTPGKAQTVNAGGSSETNPGTVFSSVPGQAGTLNAATPNPGQFINPGPPPVNYGQPSGQP